MPTRHRSSGTANAASAGCAPGNAAWAAPPPGSTSPTQLRRDPLVQGPGARRGNGSRETRRVECAVEQPQTRHIRYRVTFFLILAFVVGIAVALPVAFRSVLDELAESPDGGVFPLPLAPGVPPAPTHSRLHVSLVDIDEARLLITMRVSGNHICEVTCDYTDRIVFFSYGTKDAVTTGMPPSTKIDLPTAEVVVSETLTLPLRGHASRYPFD